GAGPGALRTPNGSSSIEGRNVANPLKLARAKWTPGSPGARVAQVAVPSARSGTSWQPATGSKPSSTKSTVPPPGFGATDAVHVIAPPATTGSGVAWIVVTVSVPVPVPVSAAVCGLPGALSVICSVAVFTPGDVGVNDTFSRQKSPGRIWGWQPAGSDQKSPASGPVIAIALTSSGVVPSLTIWKSQNQVSPTCHAP